MATSTIDRVKRLLGARPKLSALLQERGRDAHERAAAEVLGVELPSLDWHEDTARKTAWKKHDEAVARAHAARDAQPQLEVEAKAALHAEAVALDAGDAARAKKYEAEHDRLTREARVNVVRCERLELEAAAARKGAQEADHAAKITERDRLIAAARELTATRAARFAEDLVLARASAAIAERLNALANDEPSFGHLAGLGQGGREVLAAGAAHVGGAHQLQTAFVDGDVVRMWVESAVAVGLLEE